MEIQPTFINGLLIIKPTVFQDTRGYFFESYRHDILATHGFSDSFTQDNESKSQKNVLRGLHFQNPPHAQAKLVRVVKGKILDVAVDIRSASETYGQYVSIHLSEENKTMLLIPEGFAHGFVTLEDETIVNYKCSDTYHKQSEQTLLWDDKELAIKWEIDEPILSDKDLKGVPFNSFKSMF